MNIHFTKIICGKISDLIALLVLKKITFEKVTFHLGCLRINSPFAVERIDSHLRQPIIKCMEKSELLKYKRHWVKEQGRRKHLKPGGGRTLRGHLFLKKEGAFSKIETALLCLLQNLGGPVPPVPPRFQRLCQRTNGTEMINE